MNFTGQTSQHTLFAGLKDKSLRKRSNKMKKKRNLLEEWKSWKTTKNNRKEIQTFLLDIRVTALSVDNRLIVVLYSRGSLWVLAAPTSPRSGWWREQRCTLWSSSPPMAPRVLCARAGEGLVQSLSFLWTFQLNRILLQATAHLRFLNSSGVLLALMISSTCPSSFIVVVLILFLYLVVLLLFCFFSLVF